MGESPRFTTPEKLNIGPGEFELNDASFDISQHGRMEDTTEDCMNYGGSSQINIRTIRKFILSILFLLSK